MVSVLILQASVIISESKPGFASELLPKSECRFRQEFPLSGSLASYIAPRPLLASLLSYASAVSAAIHGKQFRTCGVHVGGIGINTGINRQTVGPRWARTKLNSVL